MIAAASSHIVSLTHAPANTPLTVYSTKGGHNFQRKIASMGIYPNENIEILERNPGGAMIIKVKGTRLAIGHGMSCKIKVKIF